MMWIAEMEETCVTDLIGSRCSADLFEATWGFEAHRTVRTRSPSRSASMA